METLDAIAEGLRGELDAENAARERALSLGRETIRAAANTIRAAHRGDWDGTRRLLADAGQKVAETTRLFAARHPGLYSDGYVQDAHKEYAEAALVVAILRGESNWPGPQELGVTAAAYLNGLGEAMGECRRHVLDRMRRDDLVRADQVLTVMDAVYEALVTFDYPDAVTGGLRRTTDMVRGVLERTRADIALTVAQSQLRAELTKIRNLAD